MSEKISRRDVIKGLGVAGVGGLIKSAVVDEASGRVNIDREPSRPVLITPRKEGEIEALTSTSEVFIPPRGRGYMKFSFDFPEPVVSFGEHRFGFLVFTAENTYGLDREKMRVSVDGDTMRISCEVLS